MRQLRRTVITDPRSLRRHAAAFQMQDFSQLCHSERFGQRHRDGDRDHHRGESRGATRAERAGRRWHIAATALGPRRGPPWRAPTGARAAGICSGGLWPPSVARGSARLAVQPCSFSRRCSLRARPGGLGFGRTRRRPGLEQPQGRRAGPALRHRVGAAANPCLGVMRWRRERRSQSRHHARDLFADPHRNGDLRLGNPEP